MAKTEKWVVAGELGATSHIVVTVPKGSTEEDAKRAAENPDTDWSEPDIGDIIPHTIVSAELVADDYVLEE